MGKAWRGAETRNEAVSLDLVTRSFSDNSWVSPTITTNRRDASVLPSSRDASNLSHYPQPDNPQRSVSVALQMESDEYRYEERVIDMVVDAREVQSLHGGGDKQMQILAIRWLTSDSTTIPRISAQYELPHTSIAPGWCQDPRRTPGPLRCVRSWVISKPQWPPPSKTDGDRLPSGE